MIAPTFALITILVSGAAGQDGWKRHDLQDAQVSLELPEAPKGLDSKIRAEAKQYVEKVVTYQLSLPGTYVVITYTQYVEGIAIDLRKAAEGAINNIKNQAGVSEVKSSSREMQRDDKPALSITCFYTKGNRHFSYDALIIGAGRQLWQVGVGFADTSIDGKNASRKILGSVQVGRPSKNGIGR